MRHKCLYIGVKIFSAGVWVYGCTGPPEVVQEALADLKIARNIAGSAFFNWWPLIYGYWLMCISLYQARNVGSSCPSLYRAGHSLLQVMFVKLASFKKH